MVLEGPLEGRMTEGRLRTEWMANIKEWASMREEYLVRFAKDREQWRVMTAHLLEEDGTL